MPSSTSSVAQWAAVALAWCSASAVLLLGSDTYEHPNALYAGAACVVGSCIALFVLTLGRASHGIGPSKSVAAVGLGACAFVAAQRATLYEPLATTWATLLTALLRALGENAVHDGNVVYVTRASDTAIIAGSSVLTAAAWSAMCATTLVALFSVRARTLVAVGIAVLVAVVNIVVTGAWSATVVLSLKDMTGPRTVSPALESLDYRYPLVIGAASAAILGIALARLRTVAPPADVVRADRPATVFAACAAGTALLYWGAVSGDLGVANRTRCIVDDRLSERWEPSAELLTRDRFGDFSSYSFASLVEYLGRRMDVAVNVARTYTPAYLDTCDILLLKTPDRAIPPDEALAIREWVKSGGALVVVGDHTDLSGSSSALNALAADFGIKFRFDALQRGSGGLEHRGARVFGSHPAMDAMPTLGLMTAASLELAWPARPLLVMGNVFSRPGDYAGNSNFGTQDAGLSCPQGKLVVAAAAPVGTGRVIAFSDSTVWSSFAFAMDGHRELFDRLMAYARHAGGSRSLGDVAIAVGTVLLLLGGLASGSAARFAFGVGAGALVCLGLRIGNRASAPLELPLRPDVQTRVLAFAPHLGEAKFPPALGSFAEYEMGKSLTAFTTLPLRQGVEVTFLQSGLKGLESADACFVALPVLNPSNAQIADYRRIGEWVRSGGTLCVFLAEVVDARAALPMLADLQPQTRSDLPHDEHWPEDSLAFTLGAGRVLIVGNEEALDTRNLGHPMAMPSRRQRGFQDRTYSIIEWAVRQPAIRGGYAIHQ